MSLLLSTGAFASSLSGAAPGMVLMKPTSITHSGTSATLGANGQVTFSAVTSLSLNGVFTADFDNYVISVRSVLASGAQGLDMRYRVSGADASGSNYTDQYLIASGTGVTPGRDASQTRLRIGATSDTLRTGHTVYIYGPALAQPTASRSVSADGISNARIYDNANTHSLSTAYDGFTIFPASSSMTGAVQVYGVRS